jgi:hypothetical protein
VRSSLWDAGSLILCVEGCELRRKEPLWLWSGIQADNGAATYVVQDEFVIVWLHY